MINNITSTKEYSVNYYRQATKDMYGVSISVTGDKKSKVMREAKEMLEQAINDANKTKEGDICDNHS